MDFGIKSLLSVELLSLRELAVLSLLMGTKAISIKKIREVLKIDADKLSRALKTLENYHKGEIKIPLVKREISDFDGRIIMISITSDGEELREKILQFLSELKNGEGKITLVRWHDNS